MKGGGHETCPHILLMRPKIYYNLSSSCFIFTTSEATFYFSSKLHLEKFIERYKYNRDIVNYSLSKRFKITVKANGIADISLYMKIENRGFFIKNDRGDIISCPNQLILNGGKVILKS